MNKMLIISILLLLVVSSVCLYLNFTPSQSKDINADVSNPYQVQKTKEMNAEFNKRASIRIVESKCFDNVNSDYTPSFLQIDNLSMLTPNGFEYVNNQFISADGSVMSISYLSEELTHESQIRSILYQNDLNTAKKENIANGVVYCFFGNKMHYYFYKNIDNKTLQLEYIGNSNLGGFRAIADSLQGSN